MKTKWRKLKPTKSGFDREPFEDYYGRVHGIIPSIPKCVAEQWLYRHFEYIQQYDWLLLGKVHFELVQMSTEQLKPIRATNDKAVDNPAYNFLHRAFLRKLFVPEYMIKNGTWPVPVIVLNNDNNVCWPDGEPMHEPYHLLEGHRRMGVLRVLNQIGGAARPIHDVWQVSFKYKQKNGRSDGNN